MVSHFPQRLIPAIYLQRSNITIQKFWLLLSFLMISFIWIPYDALLFHPTFTARIDLLLGQFITFHAVLEVK